MPALTPKPETPAQRPQTAAPAETSKPATGGLGGPGDGLGGMTYQQGRDAVRPPALPGMPQNGQEALQTAQKSVSGGSVGATLDEATTAYRDSDIEVVFDAGSRMTASLGYGGLTFGAQPGILVKVRNAPDVRINSARWSFDEGKFHAEVASDGFDLLGIIGRIGRWKVESVLDKKLKPLLPEAVRQAGYSPNRDPDLSGTIAKMQQMFAFSGSGEAGAGGMAGKLSAPSASLDVAMPQDLCVPLGDSGLQLIIAAGTPIDLAAQSAGKVAQPVIQSLSLRAGAKGIQIRPEKGMFKEFSELDLHSVTIHKGGTFDFDYDLTAEGAIQGIAALGELLGMAMGQPVSGQVPDVKLDAIRKEIDAKLQSEVPPRFKAFLQQYDGLVPGFSLKALFAG